MGQMPDSRLEIFDEAGHFPQLESPIRFRAHPARGFHPLDRPGRVRVLRRGPERAAPADARAREEISLTSDEGKHRDPALLRRLRRRQSRGGSRRQAVPRGPGDGPRRVGALHRDGHPERVRARLRTAGHRRRADRRHRRAAGAGDRPRGRRATRTCGDRRATGAPRRAGRASPRRSWTSPTRSTPTRSSSGRAAVVVSGRCCSAAFRTPSSSTPAAPSS